MFADPQHNIKSPIFSIEFGPIFCPCLYIRATEDNFVTKMSILNYCVSQTRMQCIKETAPVPCSPLLGNQISGQPQEDPDLLSPNLRPRHQELIPTPCGPVSCCSRNQTKTMVVLKVEVKFSFIHTV